MKTEYPKIQIEVTAEERDTILAALRLWQAVLDDAVTTDASEDRWGHLLDIATNADEHGLLNAGEIDALCEEVNVEEVACDGGNAGERKP